MLQSHRRSLLREVTVYLKNGPKSLLIYPFLFSRMTLILFKPEFCKDLDSHGPGLGFCYADLTWTGSGPYGIQVYLHICIYTFA